MNRMLKLVTGCLVGGAVTLFGCKDMHQGHDHSHHQTSSKSMMQSTGKTAVATIKPSRNATTQPANNNVNGTVTFTEIGDKVKVMAHITGLAPGTTHGFHIHASGDMSAPDLMSTGGHYNPDNHDHGAPGSPRVHAGDFGNIKADDMGMAMLDLTVDNISIGGPKNDILGKAVIVHASPDDLKTQPSGNAGARVAGGVIELKK